MAAGKKDLIPGASAPDFNLPTDDHSSVKLSGLRGKTIVLYFYPKDDTPGCTREATEFSAAQKSFVRAGALVIGVSKDTPTKHSKFKDKHSLTVTLASDEDGNTIADYGAWVEKSLYGRRYMGIDRSTFLIDGKGIIQRIWRKVKVPGHVEEVLTAVKELNST